MIPAHLRRVLWSSLLTAELNCQYWSTLSARLVKKDKYAQIFLGVMASSAVAGWGLWEEIPILWKFLSAVAAVMAIAIPIINWSKDAQKMSMFSAKWQEVCNSYELLWADVNDHVVSREVASAELERLKNREAQIHGGESTIEPDTDLARQIQARILRRRGLAA